MRFSTVTAWSSVAAGRAIPRAARRYPRAPRPMTWCADFKGEFKLGNGRYC